MVESSSKLAAAPKGLRGKVLTLVGEHGSYVATYDLPKMLDRRFGDAVDEAACAAAVEALVASGDLLRAADQPTLVRLAAEPPEAAPEPVAAPGEAALMPHLRAYLEGDFRTVVEGGAGIGYMVVDTSRRGPKKGTWRRPDFTVVNVLDLALLGRRQVDVHAIELKTESGCSVPAVFEALSQSRETNYAYLAWMLPGGSDREGDLPEIQEACEHHGMGLIRLRSKSEKVRSRVVSRPRRRPTDDLTVHKYLATRLTPGETVELTSHLGGTR